MANKDELLTGPMTPPRAEDASLPKEREFGIEDVPGLERPLKAGPNDVVVGETELGDLIYYNPTTNFKYVVSLNPDQRTYRKRYEEDVVPEIKNYLSDPSLPSGEQALDFGKALVTGAYDSLKGAVSGEGTDGDLLDTASIAALGKQAVKPRGTSTTSTPTESVKEVATEELSSPPLEIDVTDLFKSPTMDPSEWFDSQLLDLEDQLSWAGPSLKEGVEAKLTAINALGKDQLLALAENMPHYNDPGLANYNKNLSLMADSLNIYPPHLKELLSDLSMAYPKKSDPGLQDLTQTNLPMKAPIGERANPTAKTRPSDKKAEALGFKDTVYHTTLNEDGFTTFDVDKSIPGHGKAAQDYLGVHVGTPRAAAERNFAVGANKDNPMGQTLELRARTDKPLTGEGLAKILGLDPEDYHLGLKKGPFTEEEIGYFISDYEDLFVKNNPNFKGDPRELATKELRKKLAEDDYTHIPYLNDVEDPGSTSLIMLVDRPKNSPAVLRDVRAKFDPKKITDPDLRFAKGGLAENTMEQQMNRLFAEGGINTKETNVDPVSGNEVPPGSLPSEVRDDVDAKLSGGEYVVPADVLRYYGVSFFEKLRKKAKEGLGEMNAEGRIGGGKPEEDDDFPFSVEELEAEDEMAFAEGGTVPTQAPAATGFNPNDWSYDSTNVMGQSTGVTQIKKYKDKEGNVVQVLFIDGKPVVDVDALGYTEYTEKKPVATGENVAPTEVLAQEKPFEDSNESYSDRMDTNKPESAPIDPADNYYNMSAEELLGIDYNSIKGNKNAKFAGAIGTLALGPAVALGFGAAGAFQEANNLADARARSKIGKDLNYDTTEFDKKIAEMEKASSKITDGLEALGALTGQNIQKRMQNSLGTSAPVATTPGIITKTPSPIKKPIIPSIASSEPSPSSVTPSGLLSASSYSKQESDRDGGYTPTTQAKDSKETIVQAQQRAGAIASGKAQAAGATTQAKDISSSAYSGKGYTQGRAKGGLVEKPKKVVAPKTKRKTKI